ncbi:MAG TPA: hypothetical protein VFC10_07380 [Terriglobia bacterium]|jgi:hypothetical protein|nr:hypothetical protein [Terracidiphilus sp.]HZT69555.1 hypothetical protein [Terriglobia bacterium]
MTESVDAARYEAQAVRQPYWRRALGQLDVFINVLAGGAPDDTISSRMQRWKIGDVPKPNSAKRAVGSFMCWWLGKLQKDHDVKANAGDLGRAEAEESRTRRTLEKSGAEDVR